MNFLPTPGIKLGKLNLSAGTGAISGGGPPAETGTEKLAEDGTIRLNEDGTAKEREG